MLIEGDTIALRKHIDSARGELHGIDALDIRAKDFHLTLVGDIDENTFGRHFTSWRYPYGASLLPYRERSWDVTVNTKLR
jgi:hypothetical protein